VGIIRLPHCLAFTPLYALKLAGEESRVLSLHGIGEVKAKKKSMTLPVQINNQTKKWNCVQRTNDKPLSKPSMNE
jgi:hypothetical protein